MKNISQTVIRALTIPLPPLAEQRRIVARLEELRPLVDDYGAAAAELTSMEAELPDKLRASLLQEAIQGRLVEQRDDEPAVEQIGEAPEDVPFAIPEKWKWVRLGDVLCYGGCTQIQGNEIKASTWVLDLEDIQKNSGILLQKKRGIKTTSNKAIFKKGNVLYGKLRPYLNKVIIADEDGCCTTEIVPIDVENAAISIEAKYLKVYLMSSYFVEYANSLSYGVKMPRLGTRDANNASIPLPPLAEQHRIVARLEELLPEVARLAR